MSEKVEWQTTLSAYESTKFLINNEIMSDVTFLFKDDKKLFGHKLLMAKRSPVFYNFFYGSPKTQNLKIVVINDVSSESFLQLLNYIYTDVMCLNFDILPHAYYLASKYKLLAMETICMNFLNENITVEIFCSIFELSTQFNCLGLTQNCLKFFEFNSKAIFNESNFLDLSGNSLNLLLLCEEIDCSEVEIFNAVIKWSESACLKSNLKINSKNKRNRLGKCFYNIRFPNMTAFEFSKCVVTERKLFQDDEIADLFLFIHQGSIGTDRKFKFKI